MIKIDVACIIDDDPVFVFGTKRTMELIDFCNGMLVFQNGKEAINYLKPVIVNGDRPPELILLDLNMPIMDGWEFLEQFIKIPTLHQIVIYIVSSSIDPNDMDRAKQYEQVSNYIIKPVTPENLKEILQNFE